MVAKPLQETHRKPTRVAIMPPCESIGLCCIAPTKLSPERTACPLALGRGASVLLADNEC
jgi:hypothetical protein